MFLRTPGKLLLVVALAASAGVVPARSQSTERSARSFASLINVDALIDNYLRFVARKYNLTEEQDQYTEQLVRARVDDFLSRHYDELADLVDKLVTVRNGGDVAPEELIEWGQRVQPLYIEAKGIIIQTNDEWRGILTEEQRQMHDEDVRLMWESFATTEDQLSRLTAGQMSVEEFRNPRMARQGRSQAAQVQPIAGVTTSTERAGSAARQAKAPSAAGQADQGVSQKRAVAKGAAGGAAAGRSSATPVPDRGSKRTPGKRSAAGASSADQWEQYVRQFIERYALTEEQASRANKILKSCQSQRDRLMRNRAEQLEKLDRQEQALRTSDNPNKAKEQAEITAQRAKLMAPIDSIFDKQLKPRLEKIPTRAQREAAEKAPAAGRTTPGKPASVVPGGSAGPRAGKPAVPPKKPMPGPPPEFEGPSDNPDEEEGEYEEEGENK